MEAIGSVAAKWDVSNLEIRTKSVEKTLEPLLAQVTNLVNQKGPSRLKKGRSKKAHLLCEAVYQATQNFLAKGEIIANENTEVRSEILAAIDDVRSSGETMHASSSEFADDPCSSLKRSSMVHAAKALLTAVTRLLILADMVDVYLLLMSLRAVEEELHRLNSATDQQEVVESFRSLGKSVVDLADRTGRRQMDLKDVRRRDDLASARAILKKHSLMLLTTSKTYVRHPELIAARENREYVMNEVSDAIHSIGQVAQATGSSDPHPYEGIGELAAALDDFDSRLIMEPQQYSSMRTRPILEERLESIISGAALMADSSCTRDERREKIVKQCNTVRQALQDLLSEYDKNAEEIEPSESLDKSIEVMCRKTRELRTQLKKAVVDHVSDSFLETNVPLLILIEAARAGNEHQVEEYGEVFTEHANKLVEVANLACSMSSNDEGVKIVRLAANQLESLCPQVVNAARILAARPKSKVAQENMDVFKDAWERQVKVLTEAVDDITTIDDFLAVSEGHILEDVNKCIASLQEDDSDTMDRTAGAIRGRCARVCNVVTTEMENYQQGIYTDRVLEAVFMLRDQVMPNFASHIEAAVAAMGAGRSDDVDYNDFVYASQLVYDAVRDIRRAILMNRKPEDIDSEIELDVVPEEYIEQSHSNPLYGVASNDNRPHEVRHHQTYDDQYEQYTHGSHHGSEAYSDRHSHASGPASGTASGTASGHASGAASGPASGAAFGPTSGAGQHYSSSTYDSRYPDQYDKRYELYAEEPGYTDELASDHDRASDTLYVKYSSQYSQDSPSVTYSQENYVDAFIAPEELIEGKTARAWMRELPNEEKVAIQEQLDVFKQEKYKLDVEIAKWDSRGNDIIMLAKQMCMIMMEMTDFTRGRGPLKTTTHVINAAKKISEIGTKLNELCQKIATDCPDSRSRDDLTAYLGRIILCCHQLNITSKVKADIQNVGGELVVSGLDSATSLIQAAKNLMNAVVYAVKASYVASTKYKGRKMCLVNWRMKPPAKKSLVREENPEDESARVRKGAQAKRVEPIKALSEFDSY